ncbi:MAG TPA: hypothetical protein VK813_08645, partial [Edaphobacter sp.]|nr:hypothetical protein [Edaphobacter sp.]
SSGPGDQSRLYKTTDGCQTWKLIFTNPDKEGFWDALKMWTTTDGFLVGDPIDGSFYIREATAFWRGFVPFSGNHYGLVKAKSPGESMFAASNSSLALGKLKDETSKSNDMWLATGGLSGSRVIHFRRRVVGDPEAIFVTSAELSSFPKSASGGIFSLSIRGDGIGVTVGGDYLKPDETTGTAAYSIDSGNTWAVSQTPPHGYRSSVAYDPTQKLWITVGPNGTDISTDDGKNWRPLTPSGYDAPDADKNWNALSLPFVVGPHGRIGKLRTIAPAPK